MKKLWVFAFLACCVSQSYATLIGSVDKTCSEILLNPDTEMMKIPATLSGNLNPEIVESWRNLNEYTDQTLQNSEDGIIKKAFFFCMV